MKTNMLNNLTRSANKLGFKLKKHSPEILIGVGVVGVVTSTVMACKATTKLDSILAESKEKIDTIHNVSENPELLPEGSEYTEEDAKKDLTITYAQTGLKVVKLYGPAIAVGALSLGCILTSHKILRTRNVAIAAAYATIDKSFKDYRGRVVERFGERIDKELKYNIKAQEIETTTVDENGKEKKVTTAVNVVDPSDISGYARFFEKYTVDKKGNSVQNPNWQSSNEYNLMFLKQTERYCNERLQSKGVLFLNEVYEALGLPRSQEGQIVGWVYDEKVPNGDNFVDFGLYKDNLSYSDYVNGFESAILLDFNVDGNVYGMM